MPLLRASHWPRVARVARVACLPLAQLPHPARLTPPSSVILQQYRSCSSCDASSPSLSPNASEDSSRQEPNITKASPDHRTLGVQQELFIQSPFSPGSPIFLPRGALVFNRLLNFLRRQYVKYGFQEVITPTIYKKALWATSGHLENYAEDMYTVTSTSPARRAAELAEEGESEEHEFGLKPMNCPGHCLIFASQTRSYRDLPIRYADFSPLHRNEVSGALSGLTRVRRFHQDDGHIFCRPSQIEGEIASTLDFIRQTYRVLKLGSYRLVLSTRPEKYLGSVEDWDRAEDALRRALDKSGKEWTVSPGDGAFYGPKIDVILKDSDGKEHQTGTIQLDFQLPRRFNLEYTAPAPEYEQRGETTDDPALLNEYGHVRPVLIHRAVLGSAERLMALLIEQYNGRWPLWLNPRQAVVLTVNDTQPVVEWANSVRRVLLGLGLGDGTHGEDKDAPVWPTELAVDLDDSKRTVGLKVREAMVKGYGVIVTVGPKDVADGVVSVNATALCGPEVSEEGRQRMSRMVMKPEELKEWISEKVRAYE